jgi:hypothetical protein
VSQVCCYECAKGQTCEHTGFPLVLVIFIPCPECDNKRCPKATNHRHECTASNAPGQEGSRYA